MSVETDYIFRMGATHSICQDYAIAGQKDEQAFALLSDGCSGVAVKGDPGSPHTEMGARFLVRATIHHLQDLLDGEFPQEKVTIEADGVIRQARLKRLALDATLLAAVKQGPYTRTFQIGDGVVVGRYRDGRIRYYTLKFGGNRPYYLSYSLDEAREEQFYQEAKTVTTVTNLYTPGQGWGQAAEITRDLVELGASPFGWLCRQYRFAEDEFEVVLLLSDGAESFMRKGTTESIPLEAVLEQVCAFKNYHGDFITRRCTAFLTRFCVEHGWVHNDDFSCTGIYNGPLTTP